MTKTKAKRRKRVRSSVPTKIIFRVDWDAYKRGHTDGEECCDIAGVGPVPVSAVRDVIANGDPFIAAEAYGEKGHTVLPADFVTADDGTGLVHTAIAFGEDDFRLGQQYGLNVVNPVRPDGFVA